MSLTQIQIKHIANLSRLNLKDEDLIKYSKDLNSIVDYIDKLNQINDNDLKEINFNTNNILPLREDVI
jgi:aspartyl-tRNA(Asn)/glutamyl-tRNA(Gln) amidotransferase subunit C